MSIDRRRILLVVLSTVVVALAIGWFAVVRPRTTARPGAPLTGPIRPRVKRVVLITIDALRADVLACYGNPSLVTATLSGLARHAVLFEQAIVPSPWTRPSVASMLTGLPPQAHGTTAREIEIEAILPASVPTLAELMGAAGYHTAGIGDNAFLAISPNTRRGFREFAFFPSKVADSEGKTFPVRSNVGGLKLHGASLDEMQATVDRIGSTPVLANLAVDWLADHAHEDFFLWIHFFDPHAPYMPPPDYFFGRVVPLRMSDRKYGEWVDKANRAAEVFLSLSRKIQRGTATPQEVARQAELGEFLEDKQPALRRLYEAEVEFVDHAVGRVLHALEQLGLYDETLLVVTSDHGEEFWDHGHLEHGHSLKQELLRVPLLIKPPGRRGAVRVRETVSVQSVMPTILDLCSVPRPDGPGREPSLTPTWERPDPSGPVRPLFADGLLYGPAKGAVYFGNMKYVREMATGREQLYDLASDPGERTSLVSRKPPALAEGRRLLERRNQALRALRKSIWRAGVKTTAPDEARRRALRSHGYIK